MRRVERVPGRGLMVRWLVTVALAGWFGGVAGHAQVVLTPPFVDEVTDGGDWYLMAFHGDFFRGLTGLLTENTGWYDHWFNVAFDSATRDVSALFKGDVEFALAWARDWVFPPGDQWLITTYDAAIAFPFPNVDAATLDGSADPPPGPGTIHFATVRNDPDTRRVPITVLHGTVNLPSHMYLRANTFGARYGFAYGVVANDGVNPMLDWNPDGQAFTAVYMGLEASGTRSFVREVGGASQAPRLMSLWVRGARRTDDLALTNGSTTVQASQAFAQPIAVRLRDVYDVAVSEAGVTVTASIASAGGSPSGLSNATVETDADGVATFDSLMIHGPPGDYVLQFDAELDAGARSVTSASITVTQAAVAQLVYVTQPSSSNARVPLPTTPSVQLADGAGYALAIEGTSVSFTLSGAPEAWLVAAAFTTVTTNGSGVATLDCAWIDAPASNLRLVASLPNDPTVTAVSSDPFDATGAALSGVVHVTGSFDAVRVSGDVGVAGVDVRLRDAMGSLVDVPAGGAGQACTPLTGTTVTTDGQGFYRMAGLPAGVYQLDVVSGSDTPLAGHVAVQEDSLDVTLPVVGERTGIDLAFFAGAVVDGTVFRDDGAGAGVANDALRQGGEDGIPETVVEAVVDGEVVRVVSDAQGEFRVPVAIAAPATSMDVTVLHRLRPATGATGGSDTRYAAGEAGQVLALSVTAGTRETWDVGVARPVAFSGEGEGMAASPGVASYRVAVQPGTTGSVRIERRNGSYGWLAEVDDPACTGVSVASITDASVQLQGSWPRDGDGAFRSCVVRIDVLVPAGEPTGRRDDLEVRAVTTWQRPDGAPVVEDASAWRVLRTTVQASGRIALQLVLSGDGGSTFSERLQAPPGATVRQRVTFSNPGATAVRDVRIRVPIGDVYGFPDAATAPLADVVCPDGTVVMGAVLAYDPATRLALLDLADEAVCNVDRMLPGESGRLELEVIIQ